MNNTHQHYFAGSSDGLMETHTQGEQKMNSSYDGKSLSVSSWPNIPLAVLNDVSDETYSLSLRAKLLYGKHSFESLIECGDFGSKEQIITTLDACNELSVLTIHTSKPDHASTPESPMQKKTKLRSSVYSKLLKWLR